MFFDVGIVSRPNDCLLLGTHISFFSVIRYTEKTGRVY